MGAAGVGAWIHRLPPLASLLLALVVVSAAGGATIHGTARGELLRGTSRPDRIYAGAGNDRINAIGGGRDTIACGRGRDIVTVDETDRVARDCEIVSRRIANDPLARLAVGQHRTQVESHSLAAGSTIVTVFQTGRYLDGAATAIGFSTSADGGRTWRSGLLPGVTIYSPAPGDSPRASDPVVAYDAVHRTWLASTLVVGTTFSALFVNRSQNGIAWSAPVAAARTDGSTLAYDKNWIACDNGAASPFRGTCYIAFSAVPGRGIALLASDDAGATWSQPATVDASLANSIGAIPLVQPDGALTVIFVGGADMVASRSTDGGSTFAPPVVISQFVADELRSVRAPPLPAATVDAAGRLYVLWMDCRLRRSCAGNDLVLASSFDATAWSAPARLPRTSLDSFVPGIAAHPTIAGRLGVVTYLRTRPCVRRTCRFGVAFMRSTNGGATWSTPQRLDAEQIRPEWLADSNLGAFVGDYVGIAYTESAIVPTFPFATRPSGRVLNEAVFATVRPG